MRRRRSSVDDALAGNADDSARTGKSKSQLKRDMLALEPLARELIAFTDKQLKTLALDENLVTALQAARTLQRGALQRQLRYLRGLLAQMDHAALATALAARRQPQREQVRAMHELEQWRERLIEGDTALVEDLCARYRTLDRGALLTLIEDSRFERTAGRPPRATRLLFKLLGAARGAH